MLKCLHPTHLITAVVTHEHKALVDIAEQGQEALWRHGEGGGGKLGQNGWGLREQKNVIQLGGGKKRQSLGSTVATPDYMDCSII